MMPMRLLLRCAALLGAATVPCAAQSPRPTAGPANRALEYAAVQRTAALAYARLASGPPQTVAQVNEELAPLRAALDQWSRRYGFSLARVTRPAGRIGGTSAANVRTRISIRLSTLDNELLYCAGTIQVGNQECHLDGAQAVGPGELTCSYRCDPPNSSK